MSVDTKFLQKYSNTGAFFFHLVLIFDKDNDADGEHISPGTYTVQNMPQLENECIFGR